MAGQDFAHLEAPSGAAAANSGRALLPVVAILFVAGACFAAGYWLGAEDIQQTGMKTDVDAVEAQLAVKEAAIQMQQVRIESLENLVAKWKKTAEQDAHSKVGTLSFYKELPRQPVAPAAAVPKPAVAPKPVSRPVVSKPSAAPSFEDHQADSKSADGKTYRIQIASFRTRPDALLMQGKLSQAGFRGMVHAVDLDDKGLWFRVYAGPYASKQAAETSKLEIEQAMQLKNLLVRGS